MGGIVIELRKEGYKVFYLANLSGSIDEVIEAVKNMLELDEDDINLKILNKSITTEEHLISTILERINRDKKWVRLMQSSLDEAESEYDLFAKYDRIVKECKELMDIIKGKKKDGLIEWVIREAER